MRPLSMSAEQSADRRAMAPVEDRERRKRIRRTTFVVTLIVLFFYFGFMALMLVRAKH